MLPRSGILASNGCLRNQASSIERIDYLIPRIEKLASQHAVADFDCGVSFLNRFLTNFALANQRAGSSQTYLLIGQSVAGYYSLTVGDVAYADATDRLAKDLPRYPIPVMILARLAVDQNFKGQSLAPAFCLMQDS